MALHICSEDFIKVIGCSKRWPGKDLHETQAKDPITLSAASGGFYSVVPTARWNKTFFTYELRDGDVMAYMASTFPDVAANVQNFCVTLTRDATNTKLFHATSDIVPQPQLASALE